MKTATRADDLAILGDLLQAGLQSKLSESVPVQVRCLLKDGTLVILVENPADVVLNSQQTFDFLEQTILEEHSSVSPQVEMYLKVAGQKQAYASHLFALEPLAQANASDTPVEDVPDAPAIPDSPGAQTSGSTSVKTEPSQSPEASETPSTLPHPWDEPIQENDSQRNEPPQETPAPVQGRLKPALIPLIVAGTGLSLLFVASTVYVLSRPCVVGSCKVIPEAQALSQTSATRLQNPQSGKEVLEAQQQLKEAIQLLEPIPAWSSHHGKAQELIKAYKAQAEQVNQMVTALKTAARASYKSENPPHAPSQWIEVQNMWREAIAQLEQLPTDSNLQPLAQEKIQAYKANLGQTSQRLLKERQAQGYLKAAKDAGLIAQARQGVAQSSEHWQLVYSTWQTAMNRLKQIPQGTMAYQEAQQLTAMYTPQMATARDRKTEEQIAANAYKQGLRLAQLAKESQANNQWTVALSQWRNALSYVNQVSTDTFYHGKARSLAGSYSNALKQAQAQLQLVVKVQQARRDLNQTCYGKTKVCFYTIDSNFIKVRLTPTYLELVRQTSLNARVKGDSNTQTGVVNHILTLGEALEAISDNSRIPLEVYAPDGNLIQTHSPVI
ncbi:MAG TPA: hypothetical protein V6D43_16765 [Candidatus Sericytochromatia bacterium]|jgi:hypothetical protein